MLKTHAEKPTACGIRYLILGETVQSINVTRVAPPPRCPLRNIPVLPPAESASQFSLYALGCLACVWITVLHGAHSLAAASHVDGALRCPGSTAVSAVAPTVPPHLMLTGASEFSPVQTTQNDRPWHCGHSWLLCRPGLANLAWTSARRYVFQNHTHPSSSFYFSTQFLLQKQQHDTEGNRAAHLSEVIERRPCPPCPMSRKAGGPSAGGGVQSADAERESVLRFWLCRTASSLSTGLVSLSEGRMLLPLSLLSLSNLQLFSGTQIFNYLLLDLSHGSPGCVQKHLPL